MACMVPFERYDHCRLHKNMFTSLNDIALETILEHSNIEQKW